MPNSQSRSNEIWVEILRYVIAAAFGVGAVVESMAWRNRDNGPCQRVRVRYIDVTLAHQCSDREGGRIRLGCLIRKKS